MLGNSANKNRISIQIYNNIALYQLVSHVGAPNCPAPWFFGTILTPLFALYIVLGQALRFMYSTYIKKRHTWILNIYI